MSRIFDDLKESDEIRISKFINVSLTCDHRVIDGGDAGRLLKRVAELMGTPEQL